MITFSILKKYKKRLDFLAKRHKKRVYFRDRLGIKINYRKSKRKRLERHYRKCLKAIERKKRLFEFVKRNGPLVFEGLGDYSTPSDNKWEKIL